jgi:hypothetical protein
MQLEPHCTACKWKGEPGGCPFYVGPEAGFIETNEKGEARLTTGCFMKIIPRIMGFVVMANGRVGASVDAFRNDIVDRVEDVGKQLEAASGHKLAPRPVPLIALPRE